MNVLVVAVVLFGAVFVVLASVNAQRGAKDAALERQIGLLEDAIEAYHRETGSYPKSAEWGRLGLNDRTGSWPTSRLVGISMSTLKSPFDESDAKTSLREEAAWAESAHARRGKIGYVSVISPEMQRVGGDSAHWTCYKKNDVCTGWRLWWRSGDGTLHTTAGGDDITP